ncbi:MAG: hypothetical protein Q3972_06515, partial [Corynebacterium sp.]|nr:hypothetical protein [Corynebacterium sp.]
VGGHFARRRYEKRHGHPPKNVFGESMFAVSCASGLRFGRRKAQASEGPPASPSTGPDRKVYFLPRYHPWWAWWIVRVPVLREFLTSNLVIIIRK